jgi:ribosome assembly protein YihI (activator of Der GTPase)
VKLELPRLDKDRPIDALLDALDNPARLHS